MPVRIVTDHPRYKAGEVVSLLPWEERRLVVSGYGVDADLVPAGGDASDVGTFKPGEHNVDEVVAILGELFARNDVAEYKRIMDAERTGKARAGVLSHDPADVGNPGL